MIGLLLTCAGVQGAKAQTVSLPLIDSCAQAGALCQQWSSNGNYDPAFDTIRWVMLHCYNRGSADEIFGDLLGCAGGSTLLSTNAGRRQYLNWLMDTVLPLRSDDAWFCQCVNAMVAGYDHYNTNIRAELSIEQFLIENPRCKSLASEFSIDYDNNRRYQIQTWEDTATVDSLKYFDTTLPSFHELGLDTLLHYASVAHYAEAGPTILSDVRITQNPFKNETSLAFEVKREAYVHVEVLDLLGRKIVGAGCDGVFEPGSRVVPLHLRALASSAYYVRISTANNEVRTMKIVKE